MNLLKINRTTMAVHVRYKSLYTFLPSSAEQQREMKRGPKKVKEEGKMFIFLSNFIWNRTLFNNYSLKSR